VSAVLLLLLHLALVLLHCLLLPRHAAADMHCWCCLIAVDA
jgi:hypothetical protein